MINAWTVLLEVFYILLGIFSLPPSQSSLTLKTWESVLSRKDCRPTTPRWTSLTGQEDGSSPTRRRPLWWPKPPSASAPSRWWPAAPWRGPGAARTSPPRPAVSSGSGPGCAGSRPTPPSSPTGTETGCSWSEPAAVRATTTCSPSHQTTRLSTLR